MPQKILAACSDLMLLCDGRIVAKKVNFSLEAGRILAFVGENAAARQMLIETLAGFEKPHEGRLEILSTAEGGGTAFLPSPDKCQHTTAKVRKVVLSGCIERHRFGVIYTKKDREDAEASMRKLGIQQLADRRFSELSGGQRQRALLAKILCSDKGLLLLDEPCAGLDPVAGQSFYSAIRDICSTGNIGAVINTSDVGAALRYADYIMKFSSDTPIFYDNSENVRPLVASR